MNYIGINALNHEASVSVVRSDGEILFASMTERYSGKKNDTLLDQGLMQDLFDRYNPQKLFWYENPTASNLRKRITGEKIKEHPKKYLKRFTDLRPTYVNHHLSHAASGFATSKFNEACILVVDGVGEFLSTSIWKATYDGKCHYKLLKRYNYPNSLGLFYSYFTHRTGFKPNEEEYIMMGLSSYGSDKLVNRMREDYIGDGYKIKEYLHKGDMTCFEGEPLEDIATAAQLCFERALVDLVEYCKTISDNLVYVGGCALNCVANKLLPKDTWIFPNPGDGGLSLGCIAAATKMKLNWNTIFLGENVLGDYPVSDALDILLRDRIVGVCNGKAEFGPRALGNRSIFADPRGPQMKDRVNEIKKRQEFRPFAGVVKVENFKKYFDTHISESPYMQYALKLNTNEYPAISHVDGTCRVQTVDREHKLWYLLDVWEKTTGCPFLLNTSLNIKGMPMVNKRIDAVQFEQRHCVKVL